MNGKAGRGVGNAPTHFPSRDRGQGTRVQLEIRQGAHRVHGGKTSAGLLSVMVWPASSRYEPMPGLSPMAYMVRSP